MLAQCLCHGVYGEGVLGVLPVCGSWVYGVRLLIRMMCAAYGGFLRGMYNEMFRLYTWYESYVDPDKVQGLGERESYVSFRST